MTRSFPFALVLSGCLVVSAHGERHPAAAFNWRLPLSGAMEVGGRYRVVLPGVVYDKAMEFPTDIRVMDAAGSRWPHAVLSRVERRLRTLTVEERNRSTAAGGLPYRRLDLHVSTGETGDLVHDRVVIQTTGDRFVRVAEVYGAEPDGAWSLLGKGYLIRDQRPRRVRQETILYPAADFARLQVRVYPNARDATESFNIKSVQVQQLARKAPPMEALAVRNLAVPDDERQDTAEVLMVDLGYRNRPFDRVRIVSDRKDYVRSVCVYGRNAASEPWAYLGCGDIQGIDGRLRDTLDIRGRCRYVKAEVFHYDDQPLGITGVGIMAVPDTVVCEAATTGAAYLYVGGEFIKPPRYDLSKRLDTLEADHIPHLVAGSAEPNPAYRRPGFGPLGPWLAGIAVAIVSLVVLRVIIKMITWGHTRYEHQ